jgi:hypothetical protein
MIRFQEALTRQIVSPTNVNHVMTILKEYNDIVGIGSKTTTPILFVSKVNEVDVVRASYKTFYARLLSVLSSDVYFDFWVRQQSFNKRIPRAEFPNSLVTRIWFDARNVFAPEVKVLMERGDFDMKYIHSINYPHEFKDIYR